MVCRCCGAAVTPGAVCAVDGTLAPAEAGKKWVASAAELEAAPEPAMRTKDDAEEPFAVKAKRRGK